MRFQKETSPPPYLNRRDQYRMLAMVGLLMLIVVGINYTADPDNWRWFFNLGDAKPQAGPELKELKLDDIDFQVKSDRNGSLPTETFIAVADEEAPEVLFAPDADISQFPLEFLADIKDQQVNLLRREQPAMLSIIQHLKVTPEDKLTSSADDTVGFRVINVEPDTYRGRLIKIEGTLRSFTPFPFGDSETTEDDLYQAWVFTSDSGSKPWMILSMDKPANLPIDTQLEIPISVTGYFFKRYGYQSQGGMNVAPMLIAKTLTVNSAPQATNVRTENISLYVITVLGVLALLFALMIWRFYVSDRKFEKSHLAQIAESRRDAAPEAIAELNNLEAVDQNALFKQLRDSEQE